MKKLMISLFSLFAITGCTDATVKDTAILDDITVTSSEASSLIEEGALFIDVRTKEEYDEKHISGAINIPLADIESGKINYDKNTVIIVYCRSGNRSATAADKLLAIGYTTVYDLGSINNWKETE